MPQSAPASSLLVRTTESKPFSALNLTPPLSPTAAQLGAAFAAKVSAAKVCPSLQNFTFMGWVPSNEPQDAGSDVATAAPLMAGKPLVAKLQQPLYQIFVFFPSFLLYPQGRQRRRQQRR